MSMGVSVLGAVQVDGETRLGPRERTVLSALALRAGLAVRPRRDRRRVLGRASPGDVARSRSRPRWCVCAASCQPAPSPRSVPDTGWISPRTSWTSRGSRRWSSARGDWRVTASPDARSPGSSKHSPCGAVQPFADLDGWEPAAGAALRLAELRRSAEDDLLAARLASGDDEGVAVDAEGGVREEPLRERRWALLALAQYRGGRQGDALATIRAARSRARRAARRRSRTGAGRPRDRDPAPGRVAGRRHGRRHRRAGRARTRASSPSTPPTTRTSSAATGRSPTGSPGSRPLAGARAQPGRRDAARARCCAPASSPSCAVRGHRVEWSWAAVDALRSVREAILAAGRRGRRRARPGRGAAHRGGRRTLRCLAVAHVAGAAGCSWPSAPMRWPTCAMAAELHRCGRARACYLVRPLGAAACATAIERTRPARGPADRAGPRGPRPARRRGPAGRAAAPVARARRDLAAPGGRHPHRGGLRAVGWLLRCCLPLGRAALREPPGPRPGAVPIAHAAARAASDGRLDPRAARAGDRAAVRPRHRTGAGPARAVPAGDQRRRRRRPRPRVAGPQLAPAADLAGRGHRGPTRHAAPRGHGRGVGGAGAGGQRALPGRAARRGARVARGLRARPDRARDRVPRRVGCGTCRRTGAGDGSGTARPHPEPSAALVARRRRAAARRDGRRGCRGAEQRLPRRTERTPPPPRATSSGSSR